MKKQLIFVLAFLALFLLGGHKSYADTYVSGTINSNTTWSASNGVYIIQSPVTIPTGVTLTIDPGVIVKLSGNGYALIVSGALRVNGTSTDKVYFTSIKDDSVGGDTNGDGSSTTPSKYDWGGIQFYGANSIGSFDYTVVRYAGNGTQSILNLGGSVTFSNSELANDGNTFYQTSGSVAIINSHLHHGVGFTQGGGSSTISSSEFDHNNGAGIYIGNGSSTVRSNQIHDNAYGVQAGGGNLTLTNNAFENNGYGLYVSGADPYIALNSFSGNTSYGLYNSSSNVIYAKRNWWGDASGPTHSSNSGGTGDKISSNIVFKPWLTDTTHLHDEIHPVIIIPGIIGTYLKKDYGDKSQIWPDIDKMKGPNPDNYLLDLSLDASGHPNPNFPVSLDGIIRKTTVSYWGIHTTDIFDSLINDLSDNGGYTEGKDLFVFPYDWRLDLKTNVAALSEKIKKVTSIAYSKVDIVAHSMGGLVAKDYIAQNGSSKIGKLIFVGTPQTGAAKAFKTLIYGDDMDIPFLDPGTVKSITQNMPSVYELLPNRKYIANNGGYLTDLTTLWIPPPPEMTYDETKAFMLSKGSNPDMFPLTENLYSNLDKVSLNGINSYKFVGCGSATVGHITARKKHVKTSFGYSFVDDYSVGYRNGDNTVPGVSALDQDADQTYYVNKVNHSKLPSANGVHQTIRQILLNEAIGAFDDVSTDPSICTLINGYSVSDHSPVQLHIYDSEGRHTGPTSNGDMEYGIPGVAYDILGEAKFAYLPDGDTYTVKNTATDTGVFDFLIQRVDNETVTSTTSFNDVPLDTLGTNSSAAISSPTQTSFNLQVDENGDGALEANLSPTSILNQAQSADVTIPTTSISLSGTAGTNNWYTSDVAVMLNATDDNSGVLKTEYSLDNGATWLGYETPFTISNEGATTVKYFSVDKIGNMEPSKSESFKLDKTPPATTISLSGTMGDNDWYISDVAITLAATDNVSGVDGTQYSLDDGSTWNIYAAPFTVSTEGTTTVSFRSNDNAGNMESIKSQIVKIDKTPPTSSVAFSGIAGTNGWYVSNVQVALSATDNLSGVNETEYSLNNGAVWITYSSPFVISNEGINTVQYRSKDNAGNMEATKSQIVKIDKTPPESKISFDPSNGLPRIEGTDNLSMPTVTKVDKSDYTITDDAGHTLKINLDSTYTAPTLTNPSLVNIKLNSLQYDSNPSIAPPITDLAYKYIGSPLTSLIESINVKDKFSISGTYTSISNSTLVVTKEGTDLPATQTTSGLKLLKIHTLSGVLGWE